MDHPSDLPAAAAAAETPSESPGQRLSGYRDRVAEIRGWAGERLAQRDAAAGLAAGLAERTEEVLVDLFEGAAGECQQSPGLAEQGAVLAVGGSGRGEMSPYSDVDLFFLNPRRRQGPFAEFTARVVRDCWDVGLQLGHATQTTAGAISLALAEPEFATSLIEARWLWGSRSLAERFLQTFEQRVVRGRANRFFRDCVAAREAEWDRHGRSASELVPDVKRSPGGLRDIHLVRWLGFVRGGTTDLDRLVDAEVLRPDERTVLRDGHAFLTEIRIDLHLHAGRNQDLLTRDEQLRLAAERGVSAQEGQRPVERFMQEYFWHSTAVSRAAVRFAARHRPLSVTERLAGWLPPPRRRGPYRIARGILDVPATRRGDVIESLESMLTMFEAAARHGVEPSVQLLDLVTTAAAGVSQEVSPRAAELFLGILKQTGHVGRSLRHLFDTGLLEVLVPPMARVRCLMQFNHYHHFTVDEHSLRAVEAAEAFVQDSGPVGTAYRAIGRKDLLHLALLLHDLGKGFAEQHCEVGKRIAGEIAQRLGLDRGDTDLLVFLVHRHLEMEQLATRRDISEPGVVARFSREVGVPETLRMLYVLTAADVSAVGPGKWTDWKADLLTMLYDRALLMLGGEHPRFQLARRLAEVREVVLADWRETEVSRADDEWAADQLEKLTPQYLTGTTPARIVEDLAVLRDLSAVDVRVDGRNDPATGTLELNVLVGSRHATGCFHRIAGTLAALGLQVLGAEISTTATGVAIDRFRVVEHDLDGPAGEFRIGEIAETICEAVRRKVTVRQLAERYRRFSPGTSAETLSDYPTRVAIDVHSSPRCTIVDVFAHDRPGLLYTISRTLFQLGISVELARIATHVDQVVDVFYLVDGGGQKVDDPASRDEIVERLEQAIERLAREGFAEPTQQ